MFTHINTIHLFTYYHRSPPHRQSQRRHLSRHPLHRVMATLSLAVPLPWRTYPCQQKLRLCVDRAHSSLHKMIDECFCIDFNCNFRRLSRASLLASSTNSSDPVHAGFRMKSRPESPPAPAALAPFDARAGEASEVAKACRWCAPCSAACATCDCVCMDATRDSFDFDWARSYNGFAI